VFKKGISHEGAKARSKKATNARRHEGLEIMLRVPSPLPQETETLITRVIGGCIAVQRALGPGLLEAVYVRAMCIELSATAIAFERERLVELFYRDQPVARHRLDLVVNEVLVLELKSVASIQPVHHAQLLGYLRASKLPVGLLVNFNVPVLRDGVKRVIL
jgi:GxxExxY protein